MKSQGFKIGGVGSPKNEFLRLGISDSGVFEGAESILVVRFPIKSIVRVEKRGEGCVFGKIDSWEHKICVRWYEIGAIKVQDI